MSQLGWPHDDPERLAWKLKQLNRGLPREDEFAVVCTWLGKCKLIHKLDQIQAPASSNTSFQVPDLLAIFEHNGRNVPVLVEVKASEDRTLSFRPDYRNRLLEYAKALGLPMLIAWKHHSIWSLFDINHMKVAEKNYNIPFGTAVSESLLGTLAGDFSYSLPRGTGLHLRMKKGELISSKEDGSEIHEEWSMVIDDVYHTDRDGKQRRDLSADVQTLFFVNNLEEAQEHTPTHVQWHFTVEDDEHKFAHMALSALLHWYLGNGESLNWREVVARDSPVPGVSNFSENVKQALDEGVVRYIFHIEPQTMPPFLGAA